MGRFLVDTNIVIYLLKGDKNVKMFFHQFREAFFAISAITFIEILAGSFYHQKTIKRLLPDLSSFARLAVDDAVSTKAAYLLQEQIKQGHKKNFQDLVIAATAMTHAMPLVTNNPSDFKHIRGLKLISI